LNENWGALAAVLSSVLGGTAIGATRYLAHAVDPLVLGAFRFGIGTAVLLPLACLRRGRWPPRGDWPAAVSLGLLFFGLFPILFNAALIFTTAARGALALATLPLLTMIAAALLHIEALTPRKTAGVMISITGVVLSLLSDLTSAPAGAWRGDILMIGAALCMSLYNVWSKPIIRRSDALTFTVTGMSVGAVCLAAIAWGHGGFSSVTAFGLSQWWAVAYLGVFGGAAIFFLWSFALEHTTPTRVAISITVNPVSASVVGALLLHEEIHWSLLAGLVAVLLGIWIATTAARPSTSVTGP
jgi:drug/metabolite transporter (DMT)-like permease